MTDSTGWTVNNRDWPSAPPRVSVAELKAGLASLDRLIEPPATERSTNTMRLFYDCEFLENGNTIDLISIGIVAENGQEYYAIADNPPLITRTLGHDWLRKHVTPSLPIIDAGEEQPGVVKFACPEPANSPANCWYWDEGHPDFQHVKTREQIAADVRQFIGRFPNPQLWAWYGAYDHVALAQLFGRMIDLPVGIPMFTNDLKQECERLGNPRMPEQAAGQHNALEDARHNLVMAKALDEIEAAR